MSEEAALLCSALPSYGQLASKRADPLSLGNRQVPLQMGLPRHAPQSTHHGLNMKFELRPRQIRISYVSVVMHHWSSDAS